MWQVAMLPSHWDQLSEVSGALSTQEAALVHRAQPSHQQPLTSPYQPCFSDWSNPHPPHIWLLTLSDSSWEITQSFSTQLSICFFLWFKCQHLKCGSKYRYFNVEGYFPKPPWKLFPMRPEAEAEAAWCLHIILISPNLYLYGFVGVWLNYAHRHRTSDA